MLAKTARPTLNELMNWTQDADNINVLRLIHVCSCVTCLAQVKLCVTLPEGYNCQEFCLMFCGLKPRWLRRSAAALVAADVTSRNLPFLDAWNYSRNNGMGLTSHRHLLKILPALVAAGTVHAVIC